MADARRVLSELRQHGLLMKQDKLLPSVVGLVTGEALTGSWWNHARAKEIYALLQVLAERSDVLETKLVAGKVTFVSESLWPALLGVASCRENWQTAGLSGDAEALLDVVTRAGEREASGALAKELELRLLVQSEQRHTESGRHVLVLESWSQWAKRGSIRALPVAESKAALERAAASLGAPLESLPWHSRRRERKLRQAE